MRRRRSAPDLTDPISRRALERRRRRRRVQFVLAWATLLTTVLVAVVLATVARDPAIDWIATHTRLLKVSEVTAGSTRWVSTVDVVELSGLAPGDDLLELDAEAVRTRLTSHPRIADVQLRRLWNRKVRLEIEERAPIALWLEGGPVEVSADGTILGPPPDRLEPDWPVKDPERWRPRGIDLPLITGVERGKLEPGDRMESDGAQHALYFLALLRYYGRHGESWLSEVHVDGPGDLTVTTLNHGVQIRVGDGRISRRKVDAIRATLDQAQTGDLKVDYLDARFRNQVVVKLDPGEGR